MEVLGIDIGGSGIKGAIVNCASGKLLGERLRYETPTPCTPAALQEVIQQLVTELKWKGPIGCGFPGVVRNNVIYTAANLDKSCIGMNLAERIRTSTGCPAAILNDADAAGLAEMRFGAGRGHLGTVIVITVGTGIGSAIFTHGHLVANTEIGHLEFRGKEAEGQLSEPARERKELSWSEWGERFNEYLEYLHSLFWPELFILGGGAVKKFDKFTDKLTVATPVVVATAGNRAGIIGAALRAAETVQ